MNNISEKSSKKWLSALLTGLLTSGVATAAPIQYTFTQGGYEEDATISGSFLGEDLNADNLLRNSLDESLDARGLFFNLEISDFSVSFSGNSFVPEFTLGSEALQYFVFQLNADNVLSDGGVGEGVAAFSDLFFIPRGAQGTFDVFGYEAGPGVLGVNACDGNTICGQVSTELSDNLADIPGELRGVPISSSVTTQPIFVSAAAVPLTSSLLLFGLGLAALAATRRR